MQNPRIDHLIISGNGILKFYDEEAFMLFRQKLDELLIFLFNSEIQNPMRLRVLNGIKEMQLEDFRLSFVEKLIYLNQYWIGKNIRIINSEAEINKRYVFRVIEKLELFKCV